MNKGSAVASALFALLAMIADVVSLVTRYWLVLEVFSGTISRGLFDSGCTAIDCSSFNVKQFLNSSDTAPKVAAAGIILSVLLSFIGTIVITTVACGKNSSGSKAAGLILLFAVVCSAVGVGTYAGMTDTSSSFLHSYSFGYSFYIACAGGAINIVSSALAFSSA